MGFASLDKLGNLDKNKCQVLEFEEEIGDIGADDYGLWVNNGMGLVRLVEENIGAIQKFESQELV